MVAFTAEEVFKRRSRSFTPFKLKAAVCCTCRAELSAVSIETSLEIVSLFHPLHLLLPANKNDKKRRGEEEEMTSLKNFGLKTGEWGTDDGT